MFFPEAYPRSNLHGPIFRFLSIMQVLDTFVNFAENSTGKPGLVLGCCQVGCLLPDGLKMGKSMRKLTLDQLYNPEFKRPDNLADMDSDDQDEVIAEQCFGSIDFFLVSMGFCERDMGVTRVSSQPGDMALEPRNRHKGSQLPRSLPHEQKAKKKSMKNGVKRPAAVLKRPAKK